MLSDEKQASKRIADFSAGDARWMVAVRMVSEGVDVPRLAVGVYATTTSTPLFFAQAVGRFVRARKRGETASVFVPSVQRLLGFAAEMEVERDHVLGRPVNDDGDIFAAEEALITQANTEEGASDELEQQFAALGSEASFDRVVYDGGDYGLGGSDEELDFLAAHVVGRGPEMLSYTRLEAAPAVLLVALEPEEEAPIVHLRLRKAARRHGQSVFHLSQWSSPAVLKTAQTLGAADVVAKDNLVPAVPGAEAVVLGYEPLADSPPDVEVDVVVSLAHRAAAEVICPALEHVV